MTFRLESVDLAFAVGDEAYGDALHPTGAEVLIARAYLAPEHRA